MISQVVSWYGQIIRNDTLILITWHVRSLFFIQTHRLINWKGTTCLTLSLNWWTWFRIAFPFLCSNLGDSSSIIFLTEFATLFDRHSLSIIDFCAVAGQAVCSCSLGTIHRLWSCNKLPKRWYLSSICKLPTYTLTRAPSILFECPAGRVMNVHRHYLHTINSDTIMPDGSISVCWERDVKQSGRTGDMFVSLWMFTFWIYYV